MNQIMPRSGLLLADTDGRQWVVRYVVYDEAGPERIGVVAKDDADGARFDLDIHDWCRFCADAAVQVA